MKKLLGIVVLGLLVTTNVYANEVKLTCISDDDTVITELKLFPNLNQGTLYSLTTGPISKTRLVTTENRYDFYYTVIDLISARFSIDRTTGKYTKIWRAEDGETLIVTGSCKKTSPKF